MRKLQLAAACLTLFAGCQSPFQAPAIKQVAAHGGYVSWEWSPKDVGFYTQVRPVPIDDAEFEEIMRSLVWFDQLEILDMTATDIGDPSMLRIAKLHTLQRVYLSGTRVTPVGVMELRQLSRLWYVTVPAETFTVDDVNRLQQAMPGVQIKREPDPYGRATTRPAVRRDGPTEKR